MAQEKKYKKFSEWARDLISKDEDKEYLEKPQPSEAKRNRAARRGEYDKFEAGEPLQPTVMDLRAAASTPSSAPSSTPSAAPVPEYAKTGAARTRSAVAGRVESIPGEYAFSTAPVTPPTGGVRRVRRSDGGLDVYADGELVQVIPADDSRAMSYTPVREEPVFVQDKMWARPMDAEVPTYKYKPLPPAPPAPTPPPPTRAAGGITIPRYTVVDSGDHIVDGEVGGHWEIPARPIGGSSRTAETLRNRYDSGMIPSEYAYNISKDMETPTAREQSPGTAGHWTGIPSQQGESYPVFNRSRDELDYISDFESGREQAFLDRYILETGADGAQRIKPDNPEYQAWLLQQQVNRGRKAQVARAQTQGVARAQAQGTPPSADNQSTADNQSIEPAEANQSTNRPGPWVTLLAPAPAPAPQGASESGGGGAPAGTSASRATGSSDTPDSGQSAGTGTPKPLSAEEEFQRWLADPNVPQTLKDAVLAQRARDAVAKNPPASPEKTTVSGDRRLRSVRQPQGKGVTPGTVMTGKLDYPAAAPPVERVRPFRPDPETEAAALKSDAAFAPTKRMETPEEALERGLSVDKEKYAELAAREKQLTEAIQLAENQIINEERHIANQEYIAGRELPELRYQYGSGNAVLQAQIAKANAHLAETKKAMQDIMAPREIDDKTPRDHFSYRGRDYVRRPDGSLVDVTAETVPYTQLLNERTSDYEETLHEMNALRGREYARDAKSYAKIEAEKLKAIKEAGKLRDDSIGNYRRMLADILREYNIRPELDPQRYFWGAIQDNGKRKFTGENLGRMLGSIGLGIAMGATYGLDGIKEFNRQVDKAIDQDIDMQLGARKRGDALTEEMEVAIDLAQRTSKSETETIDKLRDYYKDKMGDYFKDWAVLAKDENAAANAQMLSNEIALRAEIERYNISKGEQPTMALSTTGAPYMSGPTPLGEQPDRGRRALEAGRAKKPAYTGRATGKAPAAAAGTPAAGTPAAGTPAAGTPAGTPAATAGEIVTQRNIGVLRVDLGVKKPNHPLLKYRQLPGVANMWYDATQYTDVQVNNISHDMGIINNVLGALNEVSAQLIATRSAGFVGALSARSELATAIENYNSIRSMATGQGGMTDPEARRALNSLPTFEFTAQKIVMGNLSTVESWHKSQSAFWQNLKNTKSDGINGISSIEYFGQLMDAAAAAGIYYEERE